MEIEKARDQHKSKVVSFLQKNVANRKWEIELPALGTGQETYFARNNEQSYFIKLGAVTERYQVMSKLGLSPQVIKVGHLDDGISILVQQQIIGKKPTRRDFHLQLKSFAQRIRIMHSSESLKQILPERSSTKYNDVGLEVLEQIAQRWKNYKTQVQSSTKYVDQKIQYLKDQVSQFEDGDLVASHNDICNGNWLVASELGFTLYKLE